MSRRRSAGNSRDLGRRKAQGDWQPVRLLEVDVDVGLAELADTTSSDERIWVEAIKDGQVVGLIEADVVDGQVSRQVLEELSETFRGASASPVFSIPDELLPRASVVVPTIFEKPERVARVVDALCRLDYPRYEVIVVDNRRVPDPSRAPVFSDPLVKVVHQPRRGAAAARNRGAQSSVGDFIAFTDDDAMPDATWLRALGARFVLNPEVEGVGGLVLPKELRTRPQLWFEEFYGGFNRTFDAEVVHVTNLAGSDKLFPYATGRFGSGNNMAFRRETLERLTGFNEHLGPGTPAKGGEDLEIFFELLVGGGWLAIEPAAVVRHFNRETEREFMRQVFRYGTGLTAMYVAVIARHPRHVFGIIRRIPVGLRRLFRHRGQGSPSASPSCPRRTYAYQMLGIAYGPLAYLLSAAGGRRTS